MSRRAELEGLLAAGDREGLCAAAARRLSPVLRFLVGRLYGDERERAVRALGWLAEDRALTPQDALVELMRRFVWALNDESGAVPFGVPEAMGELMARREELRAAYLPILCSTLTVEEMCQTGAIERGVLWALGRVGVATAELCPDAVAAVEELAREHADPETRAVAATTLVAISARE